MEAQKLARLSSPIHRLNPLVKLFTVALYWVIGLITLNPLVHGTLAIVSMAIYPIARLSLKTIRILLLILTPIFILFIIVNGFLYDVGGSQIYGIGGSQKTVLFHLFKWPFSLEGVFFGASVDLKILSIVLMIPLLTMTTTLPKFMAALAKLRLPYKFIFTFGVAMRLVPLVTSTYFDIMASQRLRGHDLSEMNYFKRIVKGYVPLFIPLVLTMLRRTSDMDIAIESRGFGAPIERTYLEDISPRGSDFVILGIVILFFGAIFGYLFFAGGLNLGTISNLVIRESP